MSIDELKAEALRLSPELRARLAGELLASLDSLAAEEIERLWLDEAARRDQEMDLNPTQGELAEVVLARVRAQRK